MNNLETFFYNYVLLVHIRKISSGDCSLLLDLKKDYRTLNKYSPVEYRAYLTLLTAILMQRRIFFCLTRDSLKKLMKKNVNCKIKGAFSNRDWKNILIFFYKAGLIEQVKSPTKRTAGVYKVMNPDIYNYLISLGINPESQKIEAFQFNALK